VPDNPIALSFGIGLTNESQPCMMDSIKRRQTEQRIMTAKKTRTVFLSHKGITIYQVEKSKGYYFDFIYTMSSRPASDVPCFRIDKMGIESCARFDSYGKNSVAHDKELWIQYVKEEMKSRIDNGTISKKRGAMKAYAD
jgi:hypothetical protein